MKRKRTLQEKLSRLLSLALCVCMMATSVDLSALAETQAAAASRTEQPAEPDSADSKEEPDDAAMPDGKEEPDDAAAPDGKEEPGQSDKAETGEESQDELQDPEDTEDEKNQEEEKAPEFSAEVDGLTFTLHAAEGMIPEGASFDVQKLELSEEDQQQMLEVVSEELERVNAENDTSYATAWDIMSSYDMKLLDAEGKVIQPVLSEESEEG